MNKRLAIPTRNAGISLIIIGLLGMLLPQILSITLSLLIASMLIISGISLGYLIWYGHRTNALAWLKPFILLIIGSLIAFYPLSGAAMIGLILIIFFLVDAFASISFAMVMHPLKGWLWVFLSGLLSLSLAVVFIVGWPFRSEWLVGFFIGASLFFHGVGLLVISNFTSDTPRQ